MKRLLLLGLPLLLLLAWPAAAANWAPGPESLRFGRSPAEVTRRLGPPTQRWTADSMAWMAYQRPGWRLTLGFYRQKLGHMTLAPKSPMPKKAALAWAASFLPNFKHAEVAREGNLETYFQQFPVDGHPFEGLVTLHLSGDKVTRLEGEMNWLD